MSHNSRLKADLNAEMPGTKQVQRVNQQCLWIDVLCFSDEFHAILQVCCGSLYDYPGLEYLLNLLKSWLLLSFADCIKVPVHVAAMVGELGVIRALIQASTQPGEEFCSLAVVSFLVNVRQHCNANNTCSTRPAFGREVLGSALSKKIPGLRKPGAPGRSGLHTFVTG